MALDVKNRGLTLVLVFIGLSLQLTGASWSQGEAITPDMDYQDFWKTDSAKSSEFWLEPAKSDIWDFDEQDSYWLVRQQRLALTGNATTLAVSWNAAGAECESRPAVIQWRITPDPNKPLDNNQKFMKDDANSLVGNGVKDIIGGQSKVLQPKCRKQGKYARAMYSGVIDNLMLNTALEYRVAIANCNQTAALAEGTACLESVWNTLPLINPQADIKFAYLADWSAVALNESEHYTATSEAVNGREVAHGIYKAKPDMLLHNGDIAFDLDTDDGQRADAHFDFIEAITVNTPYMAAVGDRDRDLDLAETGLAWDEYTLNVYIHRFSDVFKAVRKQSSSHNVRWYSFDKGPVHFVVLDSDAWLVPGLYGLGEQQWSWVSSDLNSVNRSNTPWLVVSLHKPMYCSATGCGDECGDTAKHLRNGILDGWLTRALWITSQLIWVLMHLMCIGLWIFLMVLVRDGCDGVTGDNEFDNDDVSKKEQDKRGYAKVESNRSHSLTTSQKVLLVCACVCMLVVMLTYVIAFVWCDQWMPSLLWWSLQVGAAHSQWQVENLFNQHKVDLVLGGHTRIYERSWPQRDGNATQHDYNDPQAPVYVVSGISWSKGCDNGNSGGVNSSIWSDIRPAWSSVRQSDSISYGMITATQTRLTYQQQAPPKLVSPIHNRSLADPLREGTPLGESTVLDTFTLERQTA